MTASTIRFARCCAEGHRLARRHTREAGASRERWWAEWEEWAASNAGGYSDTELRIICQYATAALRYDYRSRRHGRQQPTMTHTGSSP